MSGLDTYVEEHPLRLSRRDLLKFGAAGITFTAAGGGAWSWLSGRSENSGILPGSKDPYANIPGEIVGASAKSGHLLRTGAFPNTTLTIELDAIVIGGGIAGLSAANALIKSGVTNLAVLDLESEVGGNSRSGVNSVSRYPWGAHYVPLVGSEAHEVRELFEELGIIKGYDLKGRAIYNEYYLCADPPERVLVHGRWYEGLIPQAILTQDDRRQIAAFNEEIQRLKSARGSDGKRAFAIPVDRSSRDDEFLKLDRVSFQTYLNEHGYTSKPLLWYLNYSCRDDYGTPLQDVSAWAGLHYFAARNGEAANADSSTVLTWPEGNGWIVDQLKNRISEKSTNALRTGELVYNVENISGGVAVESYNTVSKTTTRWLAKGAVVASPSFVSERIVQDLREHPQSYSRGLTYAPWLVANLTLSALPQGNGAPLSWDNVSYASESLGYIVASHQKLESRTHKTVITYYKPLSGADPKTERQKAYKKTFADWRHEIVSDLEQMHFGIAKTVERLDVWLWGHAMARPVPGLLWGAEREKAQSRRGAITFAHSDLSGLSLFEEAYTQGVRAARELKAHL